MHKRSKIRILASRGANKEPTPEGFVTKRVKKDELWKPILRDFRNFVRTELGLSYVHGWYKEGKIIANLRETFKSYLQRSGASTELIENESTYSSLLVLAAPCSSNNLSNFFRDCKVKFIK